MAALIYIGVGIWLGVTYLPSMQPILGGVAILGLMLSSVPLFNKGLLRKLRGQTQQQYIAELDAKGQLVKQVFESAKAFYFADLNTGCDAYFLHVGERGTLCLYGQYCFEPIEDDEELNQLRQFPRTRFVILRKKDKPEILDLILEGDVFEPTIVERVDHKSLSQHDVRLDDGELITHIAYDDLLRAAQG